MPQCGARPLLAGVQGILKVDRLRGGLCSGLAKQAPGGNFHIFSDVSLALGMNAVSVVVAPPPLHSRHVFPMWLS